MICSGQTRCRCVVGSGKFIGRSNLNSGEPLTGSLLPVRLPGCCGLLGRRQPFFCRLAFLVEGGGQPGGFGFEGRVFGQERLDLVPGGFEVSVSLLDVAVPLGQSFNKHRSSGTVIKPGGN